MAVYELSADMNHIQMLLEFAEIIVKKNENSFFLVTWIFHSIFHMKCSTFIDEI